MPITAESAHAALETVQDPELSRSLVDLGMVQHLAVQDGAVSLTVRLTTPACPLKARIESEVRDALTGAGATRVDLTWGSKITYRDIQQDDPCPGVANVVLVMSGKGGVGKLSLIHI